MLSRLPFSRWSFRKISFRVRMSASTLHSRLLIMSLDYPYPSFKALLEALLKVLLKVLLAA
jgi:hypothetical protein